MRKGYSVLYSTASRARSRYRGDPCVYQLRSNSDSTARTYSRRSLTWWPSRPFLRLAPTCIVPTTCTSSLSPDMRRPETRTAAAVPLPLPQNTRRRIGRLAAARSTSVS
jgi:hypothetical protein